MANNTIFLLGGLGALAYFTRGSWLPTAEADFPNLFAPATGATGNNPLAPTTSTANQPISGAIPGAVPLGNDGCYYYPTGTAGSMVTNCPPGVSPPPTSQTNNCADGFTLDAAGVCTRYPDAVLLAQLNTIPWTGSTDIPGEQIARIDPQILAMYSTVTGVTSGSVLAYMLGLGANPADGTIINGSDGNAYKALSGIFYRQGTSTLSTMQQGLATAAVLGNRGYVNGAVKTPSGRIGTVSDISSALPMTRATLIQASCSPAIAALTGRNEQAMLTPAQWNSLYTQCTGIVQGIPLHDPSMIGAVMSAEQYQARRAAAGLQTVSNLGTLRPSRRGAFPLGGLGLGLINQWIPPGNRTIYQMPGRGTVPAGRGGLIPRRMGLIHDGGGDHRSARSPFPRPAWWRESE